MGLSSRWVAGLGAVLGSVAGAVWYLAGNDWFGAGDLPAMLAWSMPLGLLEALFIGPAARRLRSSSGWLQYGVLVLLGGIVAVLWSLIAALLLGPWIGAFSFPVLFCWLAGGALGGVGAAAAANRRTWPVAVALAAAVVLALGQLSAYARAPAPRVRVVVRAEARPEEVQRVWTHVLGRPTGRGDEHSMLPGLQSVAAIGHEGESAVLEVSFRKGLSRAEREALVAQIRRSPLVARVDSVSSDEAPRVRISSDY
jgi:hypothetical protein